MSDRLIAVAFTYTTHNKRKRQTSVTPAGFEHASPAIERPQTYASDFRAKGIGGKNAKYYKHESSVVTNARIVCCRS
jgi:hypothetical protein